MARIEAIILAALGAAIPVAVGVFHVKDWLATHPDFLEVLKAVCDSTVGG